MSRYILRKRYLLYLYGLLLIAAITWDWLGSIRSEGDLVKRIERRLHEKERCADDFLNSLDTLGDFSFEDVPDHITLLIIQDTNVLFWSNSEPCTPAVSRVLQSGRYCVNLNNCYYEVRNRKIWDVDYYALIPIKRCYDEKNIYLQNSFSDFFGIAIENAEQLNIVPVSSYGQNVVTSIDGSPIFKVIAKEPFKDKSVNYWLLAMYGVLFLLLFVFYDWWMARTEKVVNQSLIFVGFVLLLLALFTLLIHFQIPDSVFRLSLFERSEVSGNLFSIGELLLYVYSVFQIMAITIYRYKSNRKLLIPFRYYITTAWILFVYLYASLYSYIIKELVFNNSICMNIAAVIDIGAASWAAYMVVALGAITLIVSADRVVTVYRDFMSFKQVVWSAIVASLVILCICFSSWSLLSPIEWIVYIVLMILLFINRYKISITQQRGLYLVILGLLCGYLLLLLRHNEEKKEISDRVTIIEGLAKGNGIDGSRIAGDGYSRVLMDVQEEHRQYNLYSFALYGRNGVLKSNRGDYVYHRNIRDWVPVSQQDFMFEYEGYDHMLYDSENGDTIVVSLPLSYFNSYYYLNFFYIFLLVIIFSSYSLIYHLNIFEPFAGRSIKVRVQQAVNALIVVLFFILTFIVLVFNHNGFKDRERDNAIHMLQWVAQHMEQDAANLSAQELQDKVSHLAKLLRSDINLYHASHGGLVATSRADIFERGYQGFMVNPYARTSIISEGNNQVVINEEIGNIKYASVYAPIELSGQNYIVNVPYFVQNYSYGRDLAMVVVLAVNIVIILIMISFSISARVADWMLHPLILMTDNLKRMQLTGSNEKIKYDREDEVGIMVKHYNEAIDKLEESVMLLAKSEREGAWREMARQIAHEIKNPLTPMKLNIQFLQRSINIEDYETFKRRFAELSKVIMEQIDAMAITASAFSDFAKIPKVNVELFDLAHMLRNQVMLFHDSQVEFVVDIPETLWVNSDRVLLGRVFANLIKNGCQSIPDNRKGVICISLTELNTNDVKVSIADNGVGIDEKIRTKIFEPNFTTKADGMGLGLSISQKIVESLGGEITFCANTGQGTEFIVTLRGVKS